MDSFVTSFYNFVTSTVVPVVAEQATVLMDGATSLAEGAAQTISQWGTGSEEATASGEVFSWEQHRFVEEPKNVQSAPAKVEEAQQEEEEDEEANNTSTEWEMVHEDPEETGPFKHNQFEVVQNDYDWMKNS